ncbi:alpha/beta fold hydrolase [Methylophilus sp. UBA6697]|jgi:pimeloyl-ACP methyl ester carboxylesterase|uniref:alpha/beta fold hydrolase n=1 Tax=Methylophilus sp. UBA6697 TaxID=1946902 RepID=UPI000EB84592|nr:alpha/beta fold hydrolase [Methylophilus sp. UBA6697]HCU84493.1 alpha/beta hydrolase [Methylophilus sp.]
MQLHTQTLGQGQPLVLLHGLFGSADNWGSIAKHFAQHYQVISVDLRNHGRSPHSDSQTYPEMANDLLETFNALGLEQVHLLGHSLGGKVAMQFATQYPEKVSKLIVVDMAMRTYPDRYTQLMDHMLAVNLSQMASRNEVDNALKGSIANVRVRQFLLTNLVKNEAQLQWRINLQGLKANYATLITAIAVHFAPPSLFIRGERSDYVQDSDITELQQHFPQAEFVTLPTDHWVHAEQPQLFIQAVEAFLA